MTDEFMDLMFKYRTMFGEGFPTYQVCRTRTDAECTAIILECLEKEKDAYELGYATTEEDIEY